MRRPRERVLVLVLAQGTAQAPETVRVRGPERAQELVLEPAMVLVLVLVLVLAMEPAPEMARAKVLARETAMGKVPAMALEKAQGWVAA